MTAKELTQEFKEADLGLISYSAQCALETHGELEFLKELQSQMVKDDKIDEESFKSLIDKIGLNLCLELISFFNPLK